MKKLIIKFPITICIFLSFLTYGCSSFFYINILNIGHSSYELLTPELLKFQIESMFLSFFIETLHKQDFKTQVQHTLKINLTSINVLFCISSILFYFFPWSEDRSSRMSQVSALFRAIWFVIIILKLNGSNKDYYFLFLSLILMIIDTSRSTFASISIIHLIRRKEINLKIGFLILISILGIASFRSLTFDFNNLLSSLFLYGFFGEGVNGSLGTFQILSCESNLSFEFLTIIFSFLQPFFTPFLILFGDNFNFLNSTYFNSFVVLSNLDEGYYPMGGFYLVSEFIKLNHLGVILFLLYLKYTYWLTSKIFPFKDFAVRFVLFFLMLKMSPFTYWKWIFYICIIYTLIIWLPKNAFTKNKI